LQFQFAGIPRPNGKLSAAASEFESEFSVEFLFFFCKVVGAVLLVAGCLETDVGCDRRNSEDFGRERGQRFSNTWQ